MRLHKFSGWTVTLAMCFTVGMCTVVYAQQPSGEMVTLNDGTKVQSEVVGVVALILWSLFEKVVKPMAKARGLELTGDFKTFQPLLLGLAVAVTTILCKSGLCELFVPGAENASTVSILTTAALAWGAAQLGHDLLPGTNQRFSASGTPLSDDAKETAGWTPDEESEEDATHEVSGQ